MIRLLILVRDLFPAKCSTTQAWRLLRAQAALQSTLRKPFVLEGQSGESSRYPGSEKSPCAAVNAN